MNTVYVVTMALLGAAFLMTTARLVRGPTSFDRIMAVDVMAVLLVSGIAVHSAFWNEPAYAPLLLVVAMLGFVGSVSAARLAGARAERP
ncbi:monovalent cation/H+ antiporter complex subunit F [Actinomadura sp. 6K520]|jgi:multicomponent Na+:H+ antiporter subunit F|uniref:monovalent cation/H+ antiporter complex subunit F n=1 Tax=Actinomadura sp. 6K520 TaxID=2530364 RepID=UPI00104E22FE|nr:monovalent cation/H+ antiporter complex subunit F [Actinomadura sp. 6K520]TDE23968.1 sodium:proton antiporter [Actinomadura sp. 6K520]